MVNEGGVSGGNTQQQPAAMPVTMPAPAEGPGTGKKILKWVIIVVVIAVVILVGFLIFRAFSNGGEEASNGGDGAEPPAQQRTAIEKGLSPMEVLLAYFSAIEDGDLFGAHTYLTKREVSFLRVSAEEQDVPFEEFLNEKLNSDYSTWQNSDSDNIKESVDGEMVLFEVQSKQGSDTNFTAGYDFVKEEGEWRIDSSWTILQIN